MNDFFAIVMVLGVTPITILLIIFSYKLLSKLIDAKMGKEQIPVGAPRGPVQRDRDLDALMQRAGELQRRLANLEEILLPDQETEPSKPGGR